jgi:hypothetical protein
MRLKISSPLVSCFSVSLMAVLYVDEAGEEGFKDTSSEWFILGGALHTNADKKACCDCYDAFKAERKNQDWFFHFQTRQHDERLAFIKAIGAAPYQGMAVMFHKRSIDNQDRFKQKYWLYFYALRFLLERATKWAEQTAKEPLHLMLSSRKGLEVTNLQAYLGKIKSSSFVKRDDILWSSFRHKEIQIAKNKEFRGLQVADCIASSIFKAVELSEYGTLEPRYIRDLRPLFARHPYSGYQTASFWPSIPLHIATERTGWISE